MMKYEGYIILCDNVKCEGNNIENVKMMKFGLIYDIATVFGRYNYYEIVKVMKV